MNRYNPEEEKRELEKKYAEWKHKHNAAVADVEYFEKQVFNARKRKDENDEEL